MAKKIISFEIPDFLQETLRIAAFQERKSVSALIRDALIQKYASNEMKAETSETNTDLSQTFK